MDFIETVDNGMAIAKNVTEGIRIDFYAHNGDDFHTAIIVTSSIDNLINRLVDLKLARDHSSSGDSPLLFLPLTSSHDEVSKAS